MYELSPESKDVTSNDVPDPEVLPKLPGYQILLREIEIEEKTKGGIILTQDTVSDLRQLSHCYRVLAIGDRAYEDMDIPYCKVGDYVVTGKGVAKKFRYEGVTLSLINDDQVIMVIDSPSRLNPVDSLTAGAHFKG